MYSLYNGSPEQFFSNTQTIAGVVVPIFGWQVPAQTTISFPSIVQVVLQLVTSTGAQLSDNAIISLSAKVPSGVNAKPISVEKTIASWNALNLAQQNDRSYDTGLEMDAAYMFLPFTEIYLNIKDTVSETLGNCHVIFKGLVKANYNG